MPLYTQIDKLCHRKKARVREREREVQIEYLKQYDIVSVRKNLTSTLPTKPTLKTQTSKPLIQHHNTVQSMLVSTCQTTHISPRPIELDVWRRKQEVKILISSSLIWFFKIVKNKLENRFTIVKVGMIKLLISFISFSDLHLQEHDVMTFNFW